jgi:hypothetical protein
LVCHDLLDAIKGVFDGSSYYVGRRRKRRDSDGDGPLMRQSRKGDDLDVKVLNKGGTSFGGEDNSVRRTDGMRRFLDSMAVDNRLVVWIYQT